MFFTLIFSLFVSVHCAPQLIKLNSFPGNTSTRINDTGPFSIYVSASSALDFHLNRIFVETKGQQRVSLYQLKNYKMNPYSGFLQPFRVASRTAYIVSELPDSEMINIPGFMYITTRKQMNDNSLYVYDVDQQQTITVNKMKQSNCTLVFLNSNFSVGQSTLITKWSQLENSTVSIYHGVPGNGAEKRASQVFANPVLTTENEQFIPSVEPFSLSFSAFYMKTSGDVQFTISPEYYEVDGTRTTSPTTTGFVMKPMNTKDLNVTVNMLTMNPLFEGNVTLLTGCNTIGSMSKDASISVMERTLSGSGNGFSVTPVDQILGWSTPYRGDSVNIYSKGAHDGQFFVQYYTIYDRN